jgi:hypothetical protein
MLGIAGNAKSLAQAAMTSSRAGDAAIARTVSASATTSISTSGLRGKTGKPRRSWDNGNQDDDNDSAAEGEGNDNSKIGGAFKHPAPYGTTSNTTSSGGLTDRQKKLALSGIVRSMEEKWGSDAEVNLHRSLEDVLSELSEKERMTDEEYDEKVGGQGRLTDD